MIYFIKAVNSGAIKIGVSNNPRRRLESMQTGSPEPLELLGVLPGGVDEEHRLHRQFKAYRIHGEWFSGDDVFEQAIESLLGKPIGELLDEKDARVWMIAGELEVEVSRPLDWEYIDLFCVVRGMRDRLIPDPDAMLRVVEPGRRFNAIRSISDLTHLPGSWPLDAEALRHPLTDGASRVWVCRPSYEGRFYPCLPPSVPVVPGPVVPPHPARDVQRGSWVTHPEYGDGEVIWDMNINHERRVRVRFTHPRHGVRTFILLVSPLRPIPEPSCSVPPLQMKPAKLPDWVLADITRDRPSTPPNAN